MSDIVAKFYHAVLQDIRTLSRHSSFDALHRFFSGTTHADLQAIYGAISQELDRRETPNPGTELVKAGQPSTNWEYFQYDHEHGSTHMRRIEVPGGWLYQVAYATNVEGQWHPPTFVPTPAAVPRLGRYERPPEVGPLRDPQRNRF